MDESMRVDDVVAAAANDPAALAAAVGAGVAPSSAALSINLPAELPASALLAIVQAHATIPPADLALTEDSLTAPTDQVILAVYSALASLASKYNAESEARQAHQIESESELNTAERLRNEAEQQAAESNRQREALEAQKQQSESALAQSQSELASIKSTLESGNSASLEVKAVLEKEQREKREILETLDKERSEHNQKKDEIESLITRLRESRHQVNNLSTEAQELRAAEGSAKFRLQSLTQELDLAKKDAEWAHSELSRLNTEQTESRTKKQQELLRIRADYDEASQNLAALQSKSEALQHAFDDNVRRLSEVVREKEDLANRLASQEESFRREIETKDRLASLLERRADDSQRRVEQVEGAWERVLEERRQQEEDIRGDLQEQVARVQQVETEKEELKLALDRLAESIGIDTVSADVSRDLNGTESVRSATPTTPRRPFAASSIGLANSVNTTSTFAVSPTVALASSMQRSGKSFTEVYTTLAKTEEELRRARVENSRLANTLETVLADVKERAPLFDAQREETERLEIKLEEISADFARACEDRDSAEQDSRQSRAQSIALQRENGLIAQQLADLGRQVRTLTREIIIRDDPAAAANLIDDGSASADDASQPTLEEETIQSVISTQLVTFDSLTNLVAQNHRLLRIARQLGARMEEDEAKWRERNDREEGEAVQEAHRMIQRLESELRAENGKLESVKRERDMFRTMLSQSSSGRSTNGFAPAASTSDSNASSNALVSQLSTLQGQFDTFREETARDTEALKDQARQARDEAGKSALLCARERANREATEERLRTLQSTFDVQRAEIPELNKRLQTQSEHVARLEATSHSLSENLMLSRKELDRLRNESANLRAERDLVKAAENRLMEENQSMVKEKAGLNELLRNVQSMQNDLDRNAGEVRRRLEGQVEKLEEQAREYRDRLQKEETARREIEMRREVEVSSLQTRLDRLTTEHATAKEQLAVAKNSVEHLTRRSEDLQKQIDSKDEKLAVYERLPGATSATGSAGAGTSAAGSSLSSQQALQIELADLRADLRSARVEAEQTKAHIDQYKSIAQASEEALAELQTTYDQYKASNEVSIAQKDAEIDSLRKRLEGIAAEITTMQNETSQARQALESARAEFAAEKRSLEDAIAELGTVEERAKAEQSDVREDIKRQAQLAREAHAKYENELLAHAEDIKALSTLKEELERSRTEAREAQRNSETAQANLTSSESSWQAQRDILSREKDAMEQRIKELGEQNNVLHQHLEKLSEQVTKIRSNGAAPASDGPGGAPAAASISVDSDASFSAVPTEELQDVLKYLRREKEIVELQLNASKQESTRLRLSLEHAHRALDETKLQLAEERERSAQRGAGVQQHDELLEKINQLSILRESNATLRDESEKAARRANTLEAQLNVAQSEIEPLKEQLRSAQNELSAAQGQLRIVQEDNQRWQARAQSILSQYDRIDPEDVKKLEERASTAQARVTEVEQQLETARADLANSKDQFQRLRTQASDRIKSKAEENNKLKAELETITKQRDEATANASANATTAANASNGKDEELAETRKQMENLQREASEARSAVTAGEERIKVLEGQIAELTAAAAETAAAAVAATSAGKENTASSPAPVDAPASASAGDDAIAKALAEARSAWDAEKATIEAAKTTAENREKQHHQKAREFLTSMKQAQKERDEARKERDELAASSSGAQASAADVKVESTSTDASGSAADTTEQLKKRIAELEEALQKANARIAELEASLQTQAGSAEAAGSGDASAAHQEELDKLKAQHAEELKSQQTALSQQYQKRQSMAIDVAVKKAQSAAAGAWSSTPPTEQQIEAKVQERLAAIEARNATEKDEAVRAAVEAKVAELRAEFASSQPTSSSVSNAGEDSSANEASADSLKSKYDAGYEAGKSEASLRNQLMLKQRDTKIGKLEKEIADLKGQSSSDSPNTSAANGGAGATQTQTTPPVSAFATPPTQPARGGGPANRGARGGGNVGAATTTIPPAAPAIRGGRAIRGASASIRGFARGGARGGGPGQPIGGQKRKVSEDQSQGAGGGGGGGPGTHGAGGAGSPNAAKKPKGA